MINKPKEEDHIKEWVKVEGKGTKNKSKQGFVVNKSKEEVQAEAHE